jgi:hypothetical protein
MTEDQIQEAAKAIAEIRELEQAFGRRFLERSLGEHGLRYRALIAPNAAWRANSSSPRKEQT